jgi:CNT family concentrative nucleoside transporter
MADVSREHNSSPMPGVARNSDPALDISREHHHEHLHHSANAEKGHSEHDHVAYTVGTTRNEPNVIPQADPNDGLHHHHHPAERHISHDIEKGGLEYEEKGSLGRGHALSDPETLEETRPGFFTRFYRRFRPVFHAVIGAFFTG